MVRRLLRLLGRKPTVAPAKMPGFDPGFYLDSNPDIRAAAINPLTHFLEHGWRENRDPSRGFSTALYLEANPDVRDADINPLVHYLDAGLAEARPLSPQSDHSSTGSADNHDRVATKITPSAAPDDAAHLSAFARTTAARIAMHHRAPVGGEAKLV